MPEKYTPEQRLQCYKAMLKQLTVDSGLCLALHDSRAHHSVSVCEGTTHRFKNMPEIRAQWPEKSLNGDHLFEFNQDGLQKRKQILINAIEQLTMETTNNNQERLTAVDHLNKKYSELKNMLSYGHFLAVAECLKTFAAQEVAFETASLKAQIDLLIESETKAQDERARLQQENLQLRKALSEAQSGILASQTMLKEMKRTLNAIVNL